MEQLVRLGIGESRSCRRCEVLDVPAQIAFMRVKEAAEMLGVSPNTVRSWGAAGKIVEYRHPANGYRLYKRNELTAFLRRIKPTNKKSPKPKR